MSDNILNLAKSFKDMTELQAYCDSQYKLIIDLSKKINKLEQEKKSLEETLLKNNLNSSPLLDLSTELSNEEVVCMVQLKLLKEISDRGSLTLEETRKFEIFTKILQIIHSNKKNNGEVLNKVKDDELLSLIEKK